MAPVVHGLEAEYWGRLPFVYLDRDDPAHGDVLRTLGFRYQPEFYLLNADGSVAMQWIGYQEAEAFRAAFDSHLGG